MIDIQPVLLKINPWDATKGTSVYFTYTGSKQAIDNELTVVDKSTGQIVYKFLYSSFEKVHHLPPNQFINGKVYTAKIRVQDSDGTFSPYSNVVEFRTFKTPVLDIISIDGQGFVYNKDVTFEATYSQENNEQVKNYRFSLYDENEDLITNYPVRIPQSLNQLTEVIKNLEKGKGYFVECFIETVNGVIYSHRERFISMYLVPSINGVISTRNDEEEGFIRVTANLKNIVGTQVSGTPSVDNDNYDSNNYEYLDNEWVVVPSDRPIMFDGLGMNRASDFVLKVWCKDIPSNKKFLKFSPVDNKGISIEFWKYDDRIVAVKEYNGIVSRYRSNIVSVPKGTEFMLYAKVIEHRIDVSIQIL